MDAAKSARAVACDPRKEEMAAALKLKATTLAWNIAPVVLAPVLEAAHGVCMTRSANGRKGNGGNR
eukprot:11141760-Alexandrium_andersonii.AAC.1